MGTGGSDGGGEATGVEVGSVDGVGVAELVGGAVGPGLSVGFGVELGGGDCDG